MATVLLIEDNAGDVELVRRHLAGVPGGPFHLAWAETVEDGIATYCEGPADAVLLDLNLPDSRGLETLDVFRAQVRDAPVVILTGTADLETAVAALRRGADDYVAKDELSADLLARTIRYAIERRRMIASLEKERSTVAMLQAAGAAIASELDRERLVQKVTDLATHLVGAAFGAFFQMSTPKDGDTLTLIALSGASRSHFEHLGPPQATTLLGACFHGAQAVRVDDVRLDPRYGRSKPHHGMPQGHVPVVSYLAVPVVLRNGTAVGGLFFGHPERARFTSEHEQLALGVARWAVLGMDNARLYEEAVLASRARENLLQVVSHDLRNHVNMMGFGLEMLRRALPTENIRPLEVVERASGTMLRLLEDLVDIAAIEKGVLSVAPAPVEVRVLLEEARALFAPAVENKGIAMHWEAVPDDVQVLADRERVLQVLGNLIGNAAKFTPPGGRISVSGATAGAEIKIAIADTGPGIPPADQARIFDRFFRGSRPSGHGAGLGLAIARALVQAHAGTIGVDSTVGRGTTFWFTLPRTV